MLSARVRQPGCRPRSTGECAAGVPGLPAWQLLEGHAWQRGAGKPSHRRKTSRAAPSGGRTAETGTFVSTTILWSMIWRHIRHHKAAQPAVETGVHCAPGCSAHRRNRPVADIEAVPAALGRPETGIGGQGRRRHPVRGFVRSQAPGESLPAAGKPRGRSRLRATARRAPSARDAIRASASRIAASNGADILCGGSTAG